MKKDTAVYNAIIAALQLAAQRQATEELKNRSDVIDGGLAQGMSSAELLEKAQVIYAEGLRDGQLQHFAYDSLEAPYERGQKKAFTSPSNLTPIVALLTALENDNNAQPINIPSSPSPSPIAVMSVGEELDITAELVIVNSNQSTREHSERTIDLHGSDGLALPVSQSQAAAIDTSTPSGSHGSISTTHSTGPGPRILDLHKCPLLIAEAAIDYEMKQIYDECVSLGGLESASRCDIGICASSDSCSGHTDSSNSSNSSNSSSNSSSSSSHWRQVRAATQL